MYQAVADHVRGLLTTDTEWIDRYEKYVTTIENNKENGWYRFASDQFYVPGQFGLYMSLSDAVDHCNARTTVFELRYGGQSVAKLHAPSQKKRAVDLVVAKNHGGFEKGEKLEWSEEARSFRKLYKEMYDRGEWLPGQPEHRLESELLRNFSMKQADGKLIAQIQPVMMADTNARFQMPTPIAASNAKKGNEYIQYAKSNGGGIDILARVRSGFNVTLAVLELKDEYDPNEPPSVVMKQAVAYATFIRELLRSKSGAAWWRFFGFRGDIPEKLQLKAVVVMENHPNAQTVFCNKNVKDKENIVTVDGDEILLRYIYLEKKQISNIHE